MNASRLHTGFYDFQVWLYSTFFTHAAGPAANRRRPAGGVEASVQRVCVAPSSTRPNCRPSIWAVRTSARWRCAVPTPATPGVSPTAPSGNGTFACSTSYEHHPGLVKIGSRVSFREDQRRDVRCRPQHRLRAAAMRSSQPTRSGTRPAKSRCAPPRRTSRWCATSTGCTWPAARSWPLPRATASPPTTRCSGCCGRTSTAPSRATTWSPAGRWHAVATSRPPSALLSRACATLFDDTYLQYRHGVNDPETDGNSRGVRGAGFDTPTQQNLEDLFEVMHSFVRDYLEIYYPQNANGANDIRQDQQPGLAQRTQQARSQRSWRGPAELHLGRVGADGGGPAVLGDRAARDPRQPHVELSAVDTSPAGADISRFPA